MQRIKNLRTRGIGTFGIQADAPVEEAARTLLDEDISALVVYEGDALVGIFTKNDLVKCCAYYPDGIRGLKVRDHMQPDVYTTTVDADLDEVMDIMVEKGFRHVPVCEGDKVVGMVTSIDILVHQRKDIGAERDELIRYIRDGY